MHITGYRNSCRKLFKIRLKRKPSREHFFTLNLKYLKSIFKTASIFFVDFQCIDKSIALEYKIYLELVPIRSLVYFFEFLRRFVFASEIKVYQRYLVFPVIRQAFAFP